ncbi:VopS family T3SS effector adenosine monophosphate-protein transferase [Aeromonas veronii]|uniref:VopS family T3SS effector adenosine monophosphate-protein transferase n=1 Tax=Aeromonas TaxID=642 RepID=UPI000817EDAC|nr:VopS family T3SS effector adenosine monophosphate-protein transferase [Aeromonas veronii]KAB0674091.1 VopS family T3SS effector adenosine monophosphate-protein transferase [Aeromonas veronii]MCX9115124.1 VopS family T3SS effector adenosine monophosphate-protein transferase [Aeromonas veronii]OCQ43884.1 effector protein [Aeromonas veronii]HDO1330078.1 VopS family T3SS effector adenosine monophosphate-protein transferase [Aeromonas veronii]HDO1338473.1 VopS family T3SS effector adenosine mono
MIEFKSVTALLHATQQQQEQFKNEGTLKIAGKEYHIDANLQQVLRSHPQNSKIARFFEGVGKLFSQGSSASIAKVATQQIFSTPGAQQQRLQSDNSVAHARMLFKDRLIATPEDVLERLRTQQPTAHDNEHTMLFQRAMSEALRQSPTGNELLSLVGEQALTQLLNKLTDPKQSMTSLDQLYRQPSAAQAINALDPLLQIEVKNLQAARQHQQALLTQNLGQGVFAGTLDESFYNPTGFTDNVDRAAAWILKASTSGGNEWNNFTALLKEYSKGSQDLTDSSVLKQLHRQLVPNLTRDYRGPAISGGSLPSSIGGAAVLEKHLTTLDNQDPQLGKKLFAAVVGFHGFTDGNGRMGRLLYALSELREGRFSPLDLPAENALHGIK